MKLPAALRANRLAFLQIEWNFRTIPAEIPLLNVFSMFKKFFVLLIKSDDVAQPFTRKHRQIVNQQCIATFDNLNQLPCTLRILCDELILVLFRFRNSYATRIVSAIRIIRRC